MDDKDKIKYQLTNESAGKRKRITELKKFESEHKRVEKQIRASEEKFRLIFNGAANLIILVNKKGIIVDCNKRIQNVFGYTKEEIIGQSMAELIHPDYLEKAKSCLQEISTKKYIFNHEYKMVRKDGTAIDVRVNSARLRKEMEEHISTVCIIEDITEQKKMEEALRYSSIQWQNTFDAMNDSVSLINLEGKILQCNKAMMEFLKKPSNEIIGSFCWELVHCISEPIEGCPVIRMKETRRRETKILPIGNRWFEITADPQLDKNNKLKGAIHIISDITERKQEEEELKTKSHFLERFIDQSPLPTFVMNSDGICMMVNKAFLKAYAVPRKEMILGMNALTEPANVRQGVIKYMKEALSGKIVETPEIEFVSTFENKRTFTKSRLFPIFDANDKLINVVVVHEDITKRKLAEEKLKASLREKESFLREIHHRVKNNLQVISSLLDMSSMRTGNQQIIDLCKDAKSKIHTMALIHTHLYRSDKFSQIDMGKYIQDLFDYLSQVYSEKKKFITPIIVLSRIYLSIDQAMPCAIALNEAISNVFKHAFKEGQKGTIEICLMKSADDIVSIKIKDDGIGFKEKIDMDRVNTLGLKLMRNLVQDQLKGKLRVEHDKGTGIIIEFKIFKKGEKHGKDNGSRR